MSPQNMPAAGVDVSPALVSRLLAAEQPGLAHLPVELMSNGRGNVLCRVGRTALEAVSAYLECS